MATSFIKALCAILLLVLVFVSQIDGLKIHLHDEASPTIVLGQKQNLTFVFTDLTEDMLYNMTRVTLRPYHKSNSTNLLAFQVPGFTLIQSLSEQITTIFDSKYPSCYLQLPSNQLKGKQHRADTPIRSE
eukprot:UN09657